MSVAEPTEVYALSLVERHGNGSPKGKPQQIAMFNEWDSPLFKAVSCWPAILALGPDIDLAIVHRLLTDSWGRTSWPIWWGWCPGSPDRHMVEDFRRRGLDLGPYWIPLRTERRLLTAGV